LNSKKLFGNATKEVKGVIAFG